MRLNDNNSNTYKLLFDSVSLPVSFHNPEGIILEANIAFDKFCKSGENLKGKCIRETLLFLSDEVLDVLKEADQHVLKLKRDYNFNFSYDDPELGKRLFLCVKKAISGNEGELIGVVTTYEDITARKELEVQLKQELEFNMSIIDTVEVLIVIMDKKRNILKANSIAENVSRYSASDMVDHKFEELFISNECRQDFVDKFSDQVSGFRGEYLLTAKDGEIRDIDWSINTMKGVDSRLLSYIIASGNDVTERKMAEKQIVDRERTSRAILESTDEVMVLIDKDGHILDHNNSFSDFLGRHREDFVWQIYYDLLPEDIATERRGHVFKAMEQSVQVKFYDEIDERFYLNHAYPVQGRKDRSVVCSKDITSKVLSERNSAFHWQHMMQADKLESLSYLVSGIAHDINNPCSFITMNAPILQDAWKHLIPILDQYRSDNGDIDLGGLTFSDLRDELPALCEDMKSGADRIRAAIADLKNYIKEKPADYVKSVDVNEVVELAVLLTKNRIDKSTNNFSTHLKKELPQVSINPQRIQHAIINILICSCNFLKHPSQALNITTDYDDSSQQVIIVVKDNGAGMSEKDLETIYKPAFTDIHNEDHSHSATIAKNLINENHGDLKIESKLGEGTEFRILLPVSC